MRLEVGDELPHAPSANNEVGDELPHAPSANNEVGDELPRLLMPMDDQRLNTYDLGYSIQTISANQYIRSRQFNTYDLGYSIHTISAIQYI